MPAGPPLIADWAVTAYAEARMSKQKASKGRPSPAKAREILHDGTVHGKSITAKQGSGLSSDSPTGGSGPAGTPVAGRGGRGYA